MEITKDRMFDLTCITEGLLDAAFEDAPGLYWSDYVSQTWVQRKMREHAATYFYNSTAAAHVLDDFYDAVVAQCNQPAKCKGQRQFKLVA